MAESIKGLKRTAYCGDFRAEHEGQEVTVFGWVQRQRDLGQLIFIDLRDRTGIIQLAFDEGTPREAFDKAFAARSEYVLAARTLGVRDMALIFRHILPNSIGPIITSSMIAIPTAIFSESFLAYIGLGLQAPEPSIGVMLSRGQKVLLQYPSQVVFPAIIISLLIISFNLFGNGLRDAFDPTLRGAE